MPLKSLTFRKPHLGFSAWRRTHNNHLCAVHDFVASRPVPLVRAENRRPPTAKAVHANRPGAWARTPKRLFHTVGETCEAGALKSGVGAKHVATGWFQGPVIRITIAKVETSRLRRNRVTLDLVSRSPLQASLSGEFHEQESQPAAKPTRFHKREI